jgi:hypothetical protein
MITTIWGSRGSLATPGAATLGYGGNTSCVELRLDDGSTVVLDAGTESESSACGSRTDRARLSTSF